MKGGNMNWDGNIPRRRYAFFRSMFASSLDGVYLVVVQGDDIERAEKWGDFVAWCGSERKPETRNVRKNFI